MLFTLSPAKKLDYESPVSVARSTEPLFVDDATDLIDVLRRKSVAEVAKLMSLSDALARLNVQRYADWEPEFPPEVARPALLAFNGDVYEGLQAATLNAKGLDWAQDHLVILSGLYGALRPLDRMRPYRLEMGTRLKVGDANNLYQFWDDRITRYLNERLADQREKVVVNLASEEYFKVVKAGGLEAPVVQCVFQDWKRDTFKVISFHAKRARGLMARFAIDERIDSVKGLRDFNREGYRFVAEASTENQLVFRRRQDDA
ncbi:MAG: peroxide stress protein YaaA [Pigmentiphaga sp.]